MTAGSENVTNDGRRRGLRSQWMALLLLVPLVGCGDAEAPSVPAGGGTSSESTPRPTDTATIAGGARRAVETARGRELYAKQCASCHGATGRGDGPVAWLLSPKPRDFTKMSFRLVSTESSMATDEDLFATITRGMPGSAMPPWAHLSEEDRWALAGEVKRLTREGVIESLLEEAKAFGESLDRATAEAMAREQMEPGAPLALSSPVPESE
ncbi:MAG TPA: cytochrome c, partial [Planctomycetota bacterium]|nr:cytochrome c [Planctomycetota bacterium]